MSKTKKTFLKLEGGDRRLIGRLWRVYVRPYLATLLLAFLFMTILAAATAAYTWLLKYVVDSMTVGGADLGQDALEQTRNFAIVAVPLVLGLTVVSGFSLFIQSILSNKVALNVVGDLQKSMFASLQKTDFAVLTKTAVGTHVSRFTNDVNLVASALLRAMNNLVRDSLTLLFLIASMFYHNWQLSLIIVLVYPVAILPIIRISKRIRGTSHAAQTQMGRITSLLGESIGGTRMVRSYGLETYESKRLGAAFDERIRLYLKLVTAQARVDPIMEILGGVAIAGVLAFGVFLMASGQASGGELVAVLGAILIAAPRARALGTLNNVVQEGLAALSRIFATIDERPTITERKNAKSLTDVKGKLAFKRVRFQYGDDAQALDGISLTVKPGETIALVGPSGGGKSTLINLIVRLYDVSAGQIEIDGHDIRDVNLASLRGAMALVSQDIVLFDDSVAANIGFGRQDASFDHIEAAAKAAAAHGFIMELPDGYQTRVGEAGNTLSGGQRQRIALARAILRDAPILLLDEATSALDASSEAKVQTALNTLTKGRTVIIIAHRLSTIRSADRICVIDKGTIVEQGSHKDLLKKKGLYAKLHALQFTQN